MVFRKKLRRKEMVVFFEALAPTVIGIEACGASHHWARILRSFGHEVIFLDAHCTLDGHRFAFAEAHQFR